MTEQGFWQLLEKAWQKGRVSMSSMCRTSPGMLSGQIADYFSSHSLLPSDNSSIPADAITGMGKLLFDRKVKRKTKEAILIILAHSEEHNALFFLKQYARRPDKDLTIFTKMALDEREHLGDKIMISQV